MQTPTGTYYLYVNWSGGSGASQAVTLTVSQGNGSTPVHGSPFYWDVLFSDNDPNEPSTIDPALSVAALGIGTYSGESGETVSYSLVDYGGPDGFTAEPTVSSAGVLHWTFSKDTGDDPEGVYWFTVELTDDGNPAYSSEITCYGRVYHYHLMSSQQVANDDFLRTTAGTSIDFNVTANDVGWCGEGPEIVDGPSHGTASVLGDPGYTYLSTFPPRASTAWTPSPTTTPTGSSTSCRPTRSLRVPRQQRGHGPRRRRSGHGATRCCGRVGDGQRPAGDPSLEHRLGRAGRVGRRPRAGLRASGHRGRRSATADRHARRHQRLPLCGDRLLDALDRRRLRPGWAGDGRAGVPASGQRVAGGLGRAAGLGHHCAGQTLEVPLLLEGTSVNVDPNLVATFHAVNLADEVLANGLATVGVPDATDSLTLHLRSVDLALASMPEVYEDDLASVIPCNKDYDDGYVDGNQNPLPDNTDPLPTGATPPPAHAGEDDLPAGSLTFPYGFHGTWTMTVPTGLRVWQWTGSVWEQVSDQTAYARDGGGGISLRVEGLSAGGPAYLTVSAQFTDTNDDPVGLPLTDQVKVEVVSVDLQIQNISEHDEDTTPALVMVDDDVRCGQGPSDLRRGRDRQQPPARRNRFRPAGHRRHRRRSGPRHVDHRRSQRPTWQMVDRNNSASRPR